MPQHERKNNNTKSRPFVTSASSGRALSLVEGFREDFSAVSKITRKKGRRRKLRFENLRSYHVGRNFAPV